MELDDIVISKVIIESYMKKLLEYLDTDVAIVGGGPAGLTAAFYLSKAGFKVSMYERKLSIGGGMWGGGIMFNQIVIQEAGKEILDEFDVNCVHYQDEYYYADAIEAVSTLTSKATKAGVKIFNLLSVEDVMIVNNRVTGLVLNWSSVEMANLHVDPITIRCKYVVDATGHDAEIAHIIARKSGQKLLTETGGILGEKPMWAEEGEKSILKNTKEYFPGVYCAGMCCNGIFGGPRMGPVFGGMLLSGKKVAEILIEKLRK